MFPRSATTRADVKTLLLPNSAGEQTPLDPGYYTLLNYFSLLKFFKFKKVFLVNVIHQTK
jgi:hypothetical protein